MYNSCQQRAIFEKALKNEAKDIPGILTFEQIRELEEYAKKHRYQLICYPAIKGKFLDEAVKAIVIKKTWQGYELNFRIARFGRGKVFSGVFIPMELKQNLKFHICRGRFYHQFFSLFNLQESIIKEKSSGHILLLKTNRKTLVRNIFDEVISTEAFTRIFTVYPNLQIRLDKDFYETKTRAIPFSDVLAFSVTEAFISKPDEIEALFDISGKMIESLEKSGVIG